ncbi:MAG: hypothetical protein ACYS6W_17860 [Planctomycetota bacterium]|jgi:hypothetical protein
MANEIWHSYDEAGTLYALIWRQTDDKVYDAVAAANTFDTYTDADIDDYDVQMTNHVDSDYHSVDFPSDITAGVYRVQIMLEATPGSRHADDDIPVAQGEMHWDGTAEINLTRINTDTKPIHTGTVRAGAYTTANSVQLAADASAVNDTYNENLITIISGTGVGQSRLIADYVGGAVQAVAIRSAWLITPDATSIYRITSFSGILLANTGICAGGAAGTITLNTSAIAVVDTYVGHTVFISAGTGVGQVRIITAYTAGRVATVSPAWYVQPVANDSIYLVLPVGRTFVNAIADDAITVDTFAAGAFDTEIIGADGDTLETLSDQLDALSAEDSKVLNVYGEGE